MGDASCKQSGSATDKEEHDEEQTPQISPLTTHASDAEQHQECQREGLQITACREPWSKLPKGSGR